MIPDEVGGDQLFWPGEHEHFPWTMTAEFDDGTTETISSKEQWKQATRTKNGIVSMRCDYPAQEGKAAVFTRPLAWQAAHMIHMRHEHGIRVLAEVDDNYTSDQRLNVFMQKAGWSPNDRDNHIRSICAGDGIIVSTEYLRDLYAKALRREFGKKNLPELHVCRNHIDEQYIPERIPSRQDGRLRVGYMGSDSHIWDVDLIHDALLATYELGHEIVFVGISPGEMNPKFKRHMKTWRVPYTHIPWRNDGYRGDGLPLDIGLAPLRVDNHTLGKSDIKWLEYALSGAASVVQNCAVYNRTAVHGETALLASSPEDFTRSTLELIRNAGLRERLVANTMQYIQEERLLSKNADEWKAAVLG